MTNSNFKNMTNPDTIKLATDLVIANQDQISVSLLQRHFLLGYAAGLVLMSDLISSGIVIDNDNGLIEPKGRYSLAEKSSVSTTLLP